MRQATLLTLVGRDPEAHSGMVNTPIYKTSTVLSPSVEHYENRRTHEGVTYGRAGTPTTYAFEEAIARLENAHRAMAVGSGLAALTFPLAALLESGDHLLVTDNVYAPTRIFCEKHLKRYGVAVDYYDPLIGRGIERLIRPETRMIVLETPGTWTFEMQDVPAIAEVARRHDVLTMIDNTWATPLYFKPLDHGVDISANAVTKYIGGHSDIMLGSVASNEAIHDRLRSGVYHYGSCAAPDDCFLALRGLRTLDVRLERHKRNALKVAHWLEGRSEVARVLYPALESDPGHGLWKRDFKGATGLFGVVLKTGDKAAAARMVDGLALFGIGSSWGGYESLCIITEPAKARTATPWDEPGITLRLHIGLEDPDDLIADLAAGFERLEAAS